MADAPLTPGQLVAGKYLIEHELGRGGMGMVYVVQHRDMGKRLALKCVLPEYVQDAGTVERFMREARAAGGIHHRNVVDVFDVGRDGDTLYMVMELLDGKPLSHLLQDETLTLEGALLILVRAMEGIAAAHAQGIIHRDIKPDNIFVTYGSDGKLDDPKVLDFGVSKSEGASDGTLTAVGAAVGTPYYMSLEQLTGARDLDVRVDVYAMGVVLYEAIAGVLPHKATNVSALAIRVMTTPATPLQELRPDLPPGLCDAIMRAISRDRWQRQASMRALIDEIRPFAAQSAGLSLPGGAARPLRTPALRSAQRAGLAPSPPVGQSPTGPTPPRASRVPSSAPPPHAHLESHALGGGTDLRLGGASTEQLPVTPAPGWSAPPVQLYPTDATTEQVAARPPSSPRHQTAEALSSTHNPEPDQPAPAPSSQRWRYIGVALLWLGLIVVGGYAVKRKHDAAATPAADAAEVTNTPPPALPVANTAPAAAAAEPLALERPATHPPRVPAVSADAGSAEESAQPQPVRPKAEPQPSRHGRRGHATRDAGVAPVPQATTPARPTPTVGGKIPVPDEVRGRGGKMGRDDF